MVCREVWLLENTWAEFCRGKVLEILPDRPTVLLSVACYWRGEGTYFDFLFPNMAKNVSHSFRHGARCSRRRRKKRSDRRKKSLRGVTPSGPTNWTPPSELLTASGRLESLSYVFRLIRWIPYLF